MKVRSFQMLAVVGTLLFAAGCSGQKNTAQTTTAAPVTTAAPATTAASETTPAETKAPETTTAPEQKDETEKLTQEITLEDGIYLADFNTDSSMFHANEACEGKGVLTVKDGEMVIHVSLASKGILNLYVGLAEDAAKEGAELLQPTEDKVTYKDGLTETVYGYDIPVPAIGVEYDCALIGKKEKWYDHKISVSNPEPKTE